MSNQNARWGVKHWIALGLGLLLIAAFLQGRHIPWTEPRGEDVALPDASLAQSPPEPPRPIGKGTPPSPGAMQAPPLANARPSTAPPLVPPTPGSAALPCRLEVERGGRMVLDHCDTAERLPLGEEGARQFLEVHANALGLRDGGRHLDTVEVKHGLASTRTLFAQSIQGLPVHDAHVSVNQNASGQVTSVHSTYSGSEALAPVAPSLTALAAERIARDAAGATSLRLPTHAEPVWFQETGANLRLAWRLMVYSAKPLGDFLTLVDDASGKILIQENRIAFATGSGLIYRPNPIQTSGNTGLQDNGDATSATLDAERVSVTLLGLDEGIGTLKGEFVDLVSLAGGRNVPDANEANRVYEYDRSDDRFEQVVIYATVDAIQRYFHSLGFDDDIGTPNGIRDFPSLANAHWETADQSFYSTGDDAIHFGDGGVDDGEDADIIAHEFGHAIQHNQNSCWGGGDMGAMGEGFGDYLAASFFADQGNATYQANHAACVGEWDAAAYSSTDPPCLRRVDGNKQYPADLVNQVHADGEIWSRALWDLRQAVGAAVADRLVLEHHFILPCNASMTDAALRVLQADTNINGSANETAIRTAFCDRGILTGAECKLPIGLQLTQSLLPDPPFAGQPVTLTLTATNSGSTRLSAIVFRAPVPPGSSYVSGSASDSGTELARTVTWPAVDLEGGQQLQRSFSVLLDAGSGSSTLFQDDMEAGGGLWTTSRATGGSDWSLSTDPAQAHTLPNAWFASEPASVTDQHLTTASAIAIESGSVLEFWHSYDIESGYDGGVLETSTDGGATWSDLGSAMTLNGYNTQSISTQFQSPIGGRQAFTGNSLGYIETEVDLQSLVGSNALFRFRMTSDNSVGRNGWFVDDVLIARVVSFATSFTASGGASATSSSTVNVQPPPANTPPQLATNAGLTLVQGASAVIGNSLLRATDVDPGDTLTYTTTAPARGTLNPGTVFTQGDIDAGNVSYQHAGGAGLSDAFDFVVSDGRGGTTANATFSITVTPSNQPPVLGIASLPPATADTPYVLTVTASDPDGADTLDLFLDAGPPWLGAPVRQSANSWTLSGTPGISDVGGTAVTLRVRDSGTPALDDQLTSTLTVLPPPVRAPMLGPLAQVLMGLGMVLVIARLFAPRRLQE